MSEFENPYAKFEVQNEERKKNKLKKKIYDRYGEEGWLAVGNLNSEDLQKFLSQVRPGEVDKIRNFEKAINNAQPIDAEEVKVVEDINSKENIAKRKAVMASAEEFKAAEKEMWEIDSLVNEENVIAAGRDIAASRDRAEERLKRAA